MIFVYLTYDYCGGAYVRFRIIAHAHCSYQNKPTSKTPHLTQRSSIYLLRKPRSNPLCPKFRCHGTEGRSGKNRLAAFDGPSPKTALLTQKKSCRCLLHRLSYRQFSLKICCHGDGGRREKNLNDTIGWPGLENRGLGANIAQLFFTGADLLSIWFQNSLPWQQGSAGEKF